MISTWGTSRTQEEKTREKMVNLRVFGRVHISFQLLDEIMHFFLKELDGTELS